MESLTHLGRPIDLRLPSNRFAVGIALATTAVAWAVGSAPLTAGGSAFLAWALGRELDPDRPVTANISALAGGAVAIYFAETSVGTVYLFLIVARLLTRSTGLAPKNTDLAVHVLIAGFVSLSPVGWAAAIVLALATAVDARVIPGAPKTQYAWAAAIAAVATAVAVVEGFPAWTLSPAAAWGVALIGAAGGLVAARSEPIQSLADATNTPLTGSRVLIARTGVLVGALALAAVTGGSGIAASAPIWMTMAVSGPVRVLS